MNIEEVINSWTFEETIKTAESLMEVEKKIVYPFCIKVLTY